MVPNKYQQDFYDFVVNGSGNAVINAVAGSGKTTSIVNAIDLVDPSCSILFLAFNKFISEELKNRIGDRPNVTVSTIHALGAALCRKNLHSDVNTFKYSRYINGCIRSGKFKPTFPLDDMGMLRWARNIGDICNLGRIELSTDDLSLRDVADKHGIRIEDNELSLAEKSIRWGETIISEIDFADMIYFPNIKKMDIDTFDYVFIDECQDLNAAQRELFLKCVDSDDGRFFAVGDRHQAIYAFNGADTESFDKILSVPDTTEIPLSICYRCGKKIIDKAKEIVPAIECGDDAPDGVIDRNADINDIHDGDMVLCRMTAPLVKLCVCLIKDGKKAYVRGSDIGRDLVSMISGTKKESVDEAMECIRKDLDKVAKNICKMSGCDIDAARITREYCEYRDKIDAIGCLCEGYENTADVVLNIGKIFGEWSKDGICLSTVHKAKGLECDRVFILNEDLFYPKWAMSGDISTSQEKNIEYVAVTRSKKYLGYINLNNE